jgi:hypothetical protein
VTTNLELLPIDRIASRSVVLQEVTSLDHEVLDDTWQDQNKEGLGQLGCRTRANENKERGGNEGSETDRWKVEVL